MFNENEVKRIRDFAKNHDEGGILKLILEDMRETTKKMIVSHALNNEIEYLTKSTDELRIIHRLINKIYGGN